MSQAALRLLFLLALGLAPGLAGAEVFKWRDANGRLQYGDKPPAGVKAEKVTAEITTVPAAKNVPLAPINLPAAAPPPAAEGSAEPLKIDGNTRQKLLETCEAAGGENCPSVVNEALNAALKAEQEKARPE